MRFSSLKVTHSFYFNTNINQLLCDIIIQAKGHIMSKCVLNELTRNTLYSFFIIFLYCC